MHEAAPRRATGGKWLQTPPDPQCDRASPTGRLSWHAGRRLVHRRGAVRLPWVSLGDEPFSPEGWDGDQAVKAGGNAPQAPLDQGGEGSGRAPGSAMAGFFSRSAKLAGACVEGVVL